MEISSKMLYTMFGAVLFCVAIILFFNNVDKINEMNKAINRENTDVIYVGYEPNKDPVITEDDIYAIFMAGVLPNTIEINGTVFKKGTLIVDEYNDLNLTGEYNKTTLYGTDGKVSRIVYRSKGE